MKLLDDEMNSSAEACAALISETVPLINRTIRAQMRSHRDADLSVPQFRALAFLGRNPGASLSDVAAHVGLTLPSISKMIDRLVAQNLVERRSAADDRRRIALQLTTLGTSTLQKSRGATQAHLAERLAALSPDERTAIVQAMHSLSKVFGSTAENDSET